MRILPGTTAVLLLLLSPPALRADLTGTVTIADAPAPAKTMAPGEAMPTPILIAVMTPLQGLSHPAAANIGVPSALSVPVPVTPVPKATPGDGAATVAAQAPAKPRHGRRIKYLRFAGTPVPSPAVTMLAPKE